MIIPATGPILTAAQMLSAEDVAISNGGSIQALMESAGFAVAEAVTRFGAGHSVLILCGPGNNGGDGYVAARLLRESGISVRVAAGGPPKSDAAKAAKLAFAGEIEALATCKAAPILVDALFGTGLSRPLARDYAEPLSRLAQAAQFVIAVDLPSGVSTDNGAVLGAAQADLTLALGALKPAHMLLPASSHCGTVLLAEIGIEAFAPVMLLSRPKLDAPGAHDHKYSRGLVGIVGGEMPGAALLSATAAQRAGAGYAVLADDSGGLRGNLALVRKGVDAILADERTAAVVIGPGLGKSSASKAMLKRFINDEVALVVDADALHLLDEEDFARCIRRKSPVVLTPHTGEFRALFGNIGGNKIDQALYAAKKSGCKIIYKGADTVIASADGRATVSPTPSPWLSSAGTGDVLAGIVGAMLARGLGPHDAATAAVWLHNDAARRAGVGLIADDLCDYLPASLAACL